jgi:hypothetical protein
MKTIDQIKEEVAIRNGFQQGIFKTSWEYAMISTHRTKNQIALYEQVLLEVAQSSKKKELVIPAVIKSVCPDCGKPKEIDRFRCNECAKSIY